MIDPTIAAHIELVQATDRLAISAYVVGKADTPLRWRLEAISRSAGGSSKVTQAGALDQIRNTPVSTMAVTPGSSGTAVLYIYSGDTEIARDEVTFGETAPATND